jgi:hypothetical protein
MHMTPARLPHARWNSGERGATDRPLRLILPLTKAIIRAAGLGTYMPITNTVPKCLMPSRQHYATMRGAQYGGDEPDTIALPTLTRSERFPEHRRHFSRGSRSSPALSGIILGHNQLAQAALYRSGSGQYCPFENPSGSTANVRLNRAL